MAVRHKILNGDFKVWQRRQAFELTPQGISVIKRTSLEVSTNCKISILYPPIRSKEQVLRFEDFEVPPPRWPPLTKKRKEKLYSMTLLTFSEARVIKLNLAEIGCGVLIPIPCTHNVSN